MTTQERIVERASELFSLYGINSVRTDDISTELGISKRTFYKHFTSKEELVITVIENLLDRALLMMNQLVQKCPDSIAQAHAIWEVIHNFCRTHNPNFMLDLKKYYHRAWVLVETFKKEFLSHVFIANINTGVQQNLYRSDLNANVMSSLWLDLCQLEYMRDHSGVEIIEHFIRGLLTGEGLENYQICFSGHLSDRLENQPTK